MNPNRKSPENQNPENPERREPGTRTPRTPSPLRSWLLATTNAGKIREMRSLLDGLDLDVVTLADLPPMPAPAETGATFWENARIKALAYAQASGLITLAEDSGLEIEALGGAPGVYSARFLGENVAYADRFREIFRRLDAPKTARDARFVTAVAVVRGAEVLYEGEAAVDGEIAAAPAGSGGFGYDPIFFYPPFGKTTAQLTPGEKAAISHRGRAFRDLARWIRDTHAAGRRL